MLDEANKICTEFRMCWLTLGRILAACMAVRLQCYMPSMADRNWDKSRLWPARQLGSRLLQ